MSVGHDNRGESSIQSDTDQVKLTFDESSLDDYHIFFKNYNSQKSKFVVTAKRTCEGGKVEYLIHWTHTKSRFQTDGWYTRTEAEEIKTRIDSDDNRLSTFSSERI